MNLALYGFVFCFNEASFLVTSFLRFSYSTVCHGYLYKAINKKDFVCCHPTQIFQVGRKKGQYACCVFFGMIIVVVCCSCFRGGIEFLRMAFLYLSFTAVTFHFAPQLLFFQAFLYLKIYIK